MKLNGSEILLECILEQGVDTVFGYPGGAVLNIYDALYKYRDKITHILTSHEQGAAHAADGYSRATGKIGVCIATSGPGATNLVTGIATAYMDSIPMIAITGQVSKNLLGKDSFQEIDITGITMPVTKHNYIVKEVSELADTIRNAFRIAQQGRPGPVLIDICKNVTSDIFDYERQEISNLQTACSVDNDIISEAAEAINQSKNPIIMCGGGVILGNASDELASFAKKANIPVCTTLMGISAFDNTSPLYTGMVGMHGTKASNMAIHHSDLVLAIGARFSDRVISDPSKFAKNAKIIHIDCDNAEIDKNIKSSSYICGNVKDILPAIEEKLTFTEREKWLSDIETTKKDFPYKNPSHSDITPKFVMEKIQELTKGEAVITTEVGQNQIWAAQFYHYTKPRTYISSGGLGTMGYGLGAALGAATGLKGQGKPVINVAGDGSFQMNLNELATIKTYDIPVIQVLLDNGVLGMVRQWQTLFYGKRYSQTTLRRGTDFVALGEAFGIKSYNALNEEQFETALKEALASKKPALIRCEIGSDDKALPIVPAGKPITEMLLD